MAVAAAEERSVVHRFLRQLAAELDKVAGHQNIEQAVGNLGLSCLLYTSPSPRDS